jgi:hypothetical protein
MAANAAAAQPVVQPVDQVRYLLGQCGINPTIQNNFVNQDIMGITSPEDLLVFPVGGGVDLATGYNAVVPRNVAVQNKLNPVHGRKLNALLFFLHDKNRRGEPIVHTEFTSQGIPALLTQHDAQEEYSRSEVKDEVPSLQDGIGFVRWQEQVEAYLLNLKDQYGVPFLSVTRDPNLGPDDFTNPDKKLAYQVPLTGPAHEARNKKVFSILQSKLIDTPHWKFFSEYVADEDGGGVWTKLMELMEATAMVNSRVELATRLISMNFSQGGLHYLNERSFSFDKYSGGLLEAFGVIAHYHNDHSPETQVRRLMDGMTLSGNHRGEPIELTLAKNDICNDPNLMGNYTAACARLKRAVTAIFPTSGQKRKADSRKIAQLGRGRGRGGRFGRGGGHQRGRGGGRGGGRQGRGRGGRGELFANGVDITDPDYRFSTEEWDRMGYAGRSSVQSRRDAAGRGRGRGRGGRQGGYNNNNDRNIQQVDTRSQDGTVSQVTFNDETAIVPYEGNNNDNNTSAQHRAAGGRGGHAGRGFGRGAYGRGGRQG